MDELRCEIFPCDLDVTVDFYTRVLGFELVQDSRARGIAYVALRRGRIRVGAAQRPDIAERTDRRPPTGVELVLETDDVQAARDRALGCGWLLEEDLVERPWGLRDFRLLDPGGYYWRVTEKPREGAIDGRPLRTPPTPL